jgi:hypothetical protein
MKQKRDRYLPSKLIKGIVLVVNKQVFIFQPIVRDYFCLLIELKLLFNNLPPLLAQNGAIVPQVGPNFV